jgi:hypothetical protein
MRVHDVVILADPHEQKKREVIQEKEIERTGVVEGLKTDAIKFDFERAERRKDDDEKWHRDRRDAEENRFKVRLDGLAEITMIEERNRIKDLLDAGHTLQEIAQMHPELGMAFPSLRSMTSLLMGRSMWIEFRLAAPRDKKWRRSLLVIWDVHCCLLLQPRGNARLPVSWEKARCFW